MKKSKMRSVLQKLFFSLLGLALLYWLGAWVYPRLAGYWQASALEKRITERSTLPPVTYYLHPQGDDDRDGRSPDNAWRSLERLNQATLNPGDRVRLSAGHVFEGSILLDKNDVGTADRPILITTDGPGRATIQAGAGSGIRIHNTAGISISRLTIRGDGRDENTGSGIEAINDLYQNIRLGFLQIDSVEASGFGKYGIGIIGDRAKSGFTQVTLLNSEVHDNAEAGVYVLGKFDHRSEDYAHRDVVIRRVNAYNNPGKLGPNIPHSGSGIILSDVDGGLIEYCVAHHNGWQCESRQGGPVGIWAWDANDVTIQFNESYENKTKGKKDGGGFDLDGGATNCKLQYNYSHDNDGAGYLLAQFPYARSFSNNIVRYNISQNDSRKNSTAAIYFWGDIRHTYIYNNTVYLSPADSSRPAAIAVIKNGLAPSYQLPLPSDIYVVNNILITTDSLPVIRIPYELPSFHFINNHYGSPDSSLQFLWQDQTFVDMASWKAYSKQEHWDGRDYGSEAASALLMPGSGPVIDKTDTLGRVQAYLLQPDSSVVDAGLDLQELFGMEMGQRDFCGQSIPLGGDYDLGACEFDPVFMTDLQQ